MQNQLKLSNPSSKFLLLALGVAAFSGGCSERNIHKELEPDHRYLVQSWTLSTHADFDPGDRGADYSNPILFENTLIFGSRSVGLVSLYPTLMLTHWKLPIHGGVVSELMAEKGAVYFGGGDGFFYSVNTENGKVNWRYDLHNPIISRPTLDGGRVFVTTSDDTVYAFDSATGKWLWHYRRRSSPSATILGASQPLIDNGEVLTGLSDGFLVALSINDGQLKWEKKLHQGTKFTDVDAHPILDKEVLYVPSYDGALYALKRQGGDILWRFDAGGSKQIVLEDQTIYFPSSDGVVYAIQKSNAKQLWRFDVDGGTPTQLVVTDRYVIFGTTGQYLYVLDKMTGKGLARYNIGYESGFAGAPAYDPVRSRMYLLSGAGNLYSYIVRKPPHVFAHGQTDPYVFDSKL